MPTMDDIYRKFGDASEAAQLLETELGTHLLILQADEIDAFLGDRGEEATEILRRINRSTLGQVLRKLKGGHPQFNDADGVFAAALAARNRLAHSFYRRHGLGKFSDEGRVRMLEDLKQIHTTLLEAYKLALALGGIDIDALVAQVRAMSSRDKPS